MLKEPIYKATVSLNFLDTYKLAKKLSEPYRVRLESEMSGKIILSASYLFKFGLYFAWIKEIVIQISKISPNKAIIEVYGKPAILPHNILLTFYYIKRKIDIDDFVSSIENIYRPFLTTESTPVTESKHSLKSTLFVVSEFLSVVSSVALFLYSWASNGERLLPFFIIAFIIPQVFLVVWLTRDCYGRNSLTQTQKRRWVVFIGSTGFIGCFFYYNRIIR